MDEDDTKQDKTHYEDSKITNSIELIDTLFENNKYESPSARHVYPEALLQKYPNVNRNYNYFQRNSRQFIDEKQGEKIVRWTDSSIELLSKLIIESWLSGDYNSSEKVNVKQQSKNSDIPPPTGLFSWSSGDSYIQARKKEIQDGKNPHTEERTNLRIDSPNESLEAKTKGTNISDIELTTPVESMTNKLNYLVDIEANKFIHARIQVIKAHHSEQMSRQIHERKRKDHEIMLQKLKRKEEESENLLRLVTNEQSSKNNGFFGTLFGFGTTINNPVDANLNIDDKLVSTKDNVLSSKKRFSFLPKGNINLWSSSGNGTKIIEDKEDEHINVDHPTKDASEENKEEELVVEEEKNDTNIPNNENDIKDAKNNKLIDNEDNAENLKEREIFNLNFIDNYNSKSTNNKQDTYDDDFEEFVSSVSSKSTTKVSTNRNFITDTFTQPIPENKSYSNGNLLDIFDDENNNKKDKNIAHQPPYDLLEL